MTEIGRIPLPYESEFDRKEKARITRLARKAKRLPPTALSKKQKANILASQKEVQHG